MYAKSANVAAVEKWFGIESKCESWDEAGDLPEIRGEEIVLITGPSGAGKSRLLRRMRDRFRLVGEGRWIELESIRLPDRAAVDCFGRARLQRVLEMLGRMGLGEAWTYLRRPWQLSEGERWRMRLAKAVDKLKGKRRKLKVGDAVDVMAADEFCAVLDRVTACVVARNLRKVVDAMGTIGVVVATSHDDLELALKPNVIVRCDFQGKWTVTRDERPAATGRAAGRNCGSGCK